MAATYTYDPAGIAAKGKDTMRFELGDVMVTDGVKTAYLSDEEITAILNVYPTSWRRAKLALIESVLRRFSYEVDTKIGPLNLGLTARYEAWSAMYKELKAEAQGACAMPSDPTIGKSAPPYFHSGMHDNHGSIIGGRKKCISESEI